MEFKIESINFKPYPVAFREFRQSPDQPIGKDLKRRGRTLAKLAKVSAPRRTGRLSKSIKLMSYNRGVTNPFVRVGSNHRIAYIMHEGSRPHAIRAKPGRTLRFVYNGRVVYAQKVNHPGTKPTNYLSKHLRTVTR